MRILNITEYCWDFAALVLVSFLVCTPCYGEHIDWLEFKLLQFYIDLRGVEYQKTTRLVSWDVVRVVLHLVDHEESPDFPVIIQCGADDFCARTAELEQRVDLMFGKVIGQRSTVSFDVVNNGGTFNRFITWSISSSSSSSRVANGLSDSNVSEWLHTTSSLRDTQFPDSSPPEIMKIKRTKMKLESELTCLLHTAVRRWMITIVRPSCTIIAQASVHKYLHRRLFIEIVKYDALGSIVWCYMVTKILETFDFSTLCLEIAISGACWHQSCLVLLPIMAGLITKNHSIRSSSLLGQFANY